MIKIYYELKDILKDKNLYSFYDNESLINNMLDKLDKKFEFHIKHAKTYIVEQYKEREWTKLYSIHYGQVFNKKIINQTLRVHF